MSIYREKLTYYTNKGGIKMNKRLTLKSVAKDYLTHLEENRGITLIAQ